MKYLILAILLIAGTAEAAGPRYPNIDRFFSEPTLRVYARAPYSSNPYYAPNPNYLPPTPAYEQFSNNQFYSKDAPLCKPPRGILEILTPGTYTIKQPEPEAYGPPPTIGK